MLVQHSQRKYNRITELESKVRVQYMARVLIGYSYFKAAVSTMRKVRYSPTAFTPYVA